MTQPHQILLLIAGIAVLLGAIFIAIGVIRGRMMRGWVATTGQVINQRGDPRGGMAARYPTFRWTDDKGVEHRHTSSVNASFGPRPGTLVTVRYDPANPSRGAIDSFVQSGQIFTVSGVVISLMGVMAAAGSWWLLSSFNQL